MKTVELFLGETESFDAEYRCIVAGAFSPGSRSSQFR